MTVSPSRYLVYPTDAIRKVRERGASTVTQFCQRLPNQLPRLLMEVKFTEMPLSEYPCDPLLLSQVNIHPIILGTTVDYLTRCYALAKTHPDKITRNVLDTYHLAIAGAEILTMTGMSIEGQHPVRHAEWCLSTIDHWLKQGHFAEDDAISLDAMIAVVMLSYYISVYRAGPGIMTQDKMIRPDIPTCQVIQTLALRSYAFLIQQESLCCGITFEGAYGGSIQKGDADYLSRDTLWDMKVSEKPPGTKEKLQLLTYFLMLEKTHAYRERLPRYVSILNPVLNCYYQIDVQNDIRPLLVTIVRDCIYDPSVPYASEVKTSCLPQLKDIDNSKSDGASPPSAWRKLGKVLMTTLLVIGGILMILAKVSPPTRTRRRRR